jgi:hypothetical protein
MNESPLLEKASSFVASSVSPSSARDDEVGVDRGVEDPVGDDLDADRLALGRGDGVVVEVASLFDVTDDVDRRSSSVLASVSFGSCSLTSPSPVPWRPLEGRAPELPCRKGRALAVGNAPEGALVARRSFDASAPARAAKSSERVWTAAGAGAESRAGARLAAVFSRSARP